MPTLVLPLSSFIVPLAKIANIPETASKTAITLHTEFVFINYNKAGSNIKDKTEISKVPGSYFLINKEEISALIKFVYEHNYSLLILGWGIWDKEILEQVLKDVANSLDLSEELKLKFSAAPFSSVASEAINRGKEQGEVNRDSTVNRLKEFIKFHKLFGKNFVLLTEDPRDFAACENKNIQPLHLDLKQPDMEVYKKAERYLQEYRRMGCLAVTSFLFTNPRSNKRLKTEPQEGSENCKVSLTAAP